MTMGSEPREVRRRTEEGTPEEEVPARRITRGRFLGGLGAASALMAVGGGVFVDPAQAAVFFYNSGTIERLRHPDGRLG